MEGQGRVGQGRAGQGRRAPFLRGAQMGSARHEDGPSRGCYRPHGCGEAGERPGSPCAIEVEELKRRPPTVVGRPKP